MLSKSLDVSQLVGAPDLRPTAENARVKTAPNRPQEIDCPDRGREAVPGAQRFAPW